VFKYSTQSYTVGVWNKGGKRCTIILTDCAVSQVPWASGVQWLGVSCGWDPWGWTGGKSNGKKIGINFHLLLILHGKQVYNDSKQQQAIERMVLATTQDAYERVFVFLLSISIQKKGQPRAFSTTFKRRDPPGGVEDQYTVFTYWQRVKKRHYRTIFLFWNFAPLIFSSILQVECGKTKGADSSTVFTFLQDTFILPHIICDVQVHL
jgi:hypothetical protein